MAKSPMLIPKDKRRIMPLTPADIFAVNGKTFVLALLEVEGAET